MAVLFNIAYSCSLCVVRCWLYVGNLWVSFTVKDYQLIQSQDSTTTSLPAQPASHSCQKTLLSRYLSNFTSIISHLLQANQDNGFPDAVEASWVLSLALKGLYNTLKVAANQNPHAVPSCLCCLNVAFLSLCSALLGRSTAWSTRTRPSRSPA